MSRSQPRSWRITVVVTGAVTLASCAGAGLSAEPATTVTTAATDSTHPTGPAATTPSTPRPRTPSPNTDPSPTGPSTSDSDSWPTFVAAACDQLVSRIASIPAHDGTTAGVEAFVAAHRDARAGLSLLSAVDLPADLESEIATNEFAGEAALTAAQTAAAAGDVDAAQSAIDDYFDSLARTANAVAIAGVRCGPGDPARADASLNLLFDFSPLNITAGFGSIWITEHDGDRVARVDPDTGEVLATVDIPMTPVKLQPADGLMWGRTEDDFFAIDPATNTVTATLPKTDVGPNADRVWAVDGGLWICDGQRLHRYDTTTLRQVVVIDLGIACDLPGGTPDLIVASTYNRDDGQSGTSAAAFIDPATNQLLASVELPVDVSIGIVLDDVVFFAAERGTRAVVIDRASWSVSAVPEFGRATGDLGTIETDGTSIYIPTLDQRDVLVVDATTFTVTDTVEPLGVHSVTILDRSLWVSSYDFTVQRFDLTG